MSYHPDSKDVIVRPLINTEMAGTYFLPVGRLAVMGIQVGYLQQLGKNLIELLNNLIVHLRKFQLLLILLLFLLQ